ncbi:MAG: hypothetical protein ABSA78_04115 [Candidatus Sulfotelmatobacter sp.]
MEARARWLWIVTLANIAAATLLILVIRAMMFALAAFSPYVPGWPLFVLLPLGLALSTVGLRFSVTVASSIARRIGYVANGCALAVNLVVIIGVAAIFLRSTEEQVILPGGYRGDVYIIRGAADGQPSKTRWSSPTGFRPMGFYRVQSRCSAV